MFFLFLIASIWAGPTYHCKFSLHPISQKDSTVYLGETEVAPSEKVQYKKIQLTLHETEPQLKRLSKTLESFSLGYTNSMEKGLFFLLREGLDAPVIDVVTDFNARRAQSIARAYPFEASKPGPSMAWLECRRK